MDAMGVAQMHKPVCILIDQHSPYHHSMGNLMTRGDKMARPDCGLFIGIGTGTSGQFLGEGSNSEYWIIDEHNEQYIKLSNPRGLLLVLKERLEQLERDDRHRLPSEN
jgi:hypothetical protein